MNSEKILEDLANRMATASSKTALVGMDGFIDKIVKPVANRYGQGPAYEPFPTIAAFGQRILDAAGKSANIELYEEYQKLGGNGPIMANALLSEGLSVQYIGALGQPIEPVFKEFAQKTHAVSLSPPGVTHALEFEDGKLMLGRTTPLEAITFERILEVMGEGAFHDAINRTDLVAIVNWTMIPNMTPLLEGLLTRVLPYLGPRENGRTFFFDLADPAKRSKSEIAEVLSVISRFRSYGSVTLGLNYAEACQCAEVLEVKNPGTDPEELKLAATRIRNELNLGCVVIHPRESAACATHDGAWHVEGPFCKNPKLSTGAGDNFNAGFAAAQVIGLHPESCLAVAVATSGQYVRNARSPSLRETHRFIESWTSGRLSD
jgi:sugar/nucleoside kinase (ribokinase family)